MTRRSTPERLHAARRAATVQRLSARASQRLKAERLVAESELPVDRDGLSRDGRYWDAGWAWVLAQRR